MLPYLIAGAIGFGIGKLFENGGETFMAGGKITTNEDVLNSFLTSSKEVKVNNLSTHFNEYENLLLLRNYGTIIAGRYVNTNEKDYRYGTLNFCYVTKTKYSQTTTKILNKLKALATKMGYTITDACTFDDGGEMFMAGGNTGVNIEEGDSVIMYFNQDTELEIFDSEDFELEEPNSDIFKKGEEFEVDIFGVDDIKYDVQFGDGSVAFIRKDNVTIVSVNEDKYVGGGRITKYVQLYFVQGNYGQGWEDLTAHDNRKDARSEMRVYDDNESYPHRVIQRRVLRTDYEKGKYGGGGEITDADLNYYIYSTKQVRIAYLGKIQMGAYFSLKDALKEIEYLTMAYPKNEIEKYAIITPDKTFHLGKKEYNIRFDNGGETFMAGGMTNEDIIFEYPKDSNGRIMSWINVGTGNMEIASKTGTVGQVRDGHQLIVLKSETPNKVDYHILVDYLPEENKINMVRGKFNSEPSPKYQSYINDLFRMLKISQTTRDYQDEDIANQVYVKRYLINNFGNPPKGCQIKATELGVEIHFDSTNKMSSDWAMKIADKYGYPSGNFEMRYSSGNVPITYVDTSKIDKNTSKSGKGYFNFGETFMAGGVVDSYSVDYDDVNGQEFRDETFDTFREAKLKFDELSKKGKTFEDVPLDNVQLVQVYKNGEYEILDSKFFGKYDNGGEADDKYGGQRNKIVTELKSLKGGLNNKAPYVFVKEGYIYVSAENGDNYADYYEYTIDEKLEDLADRYNTYWDWETADSIVLVPIDTYVGGGKASNLSSVKRKYLKNEDENAHSENVVLLAENFGDSEDIKLAKKILKLHNTEGHLSTENGKKRHILHLKLLKIARKKFGQEGIEFENGGEADGGLPKKRRRSASVQYGRSDTAVDKTRVAKPVGYRFTNAKASELRKDPYDKPTEAEVKKYLGKGIYKENRKRHSDKDRNAKL